MSKFDAMKRIVISLFILVTIVGSSCKKKETIQTQPGTGSFDLFFDNVVKTEELLLNDHWYINHVGDSFRITKFDYYISNVTFQGTSTYAEEESYHLVRESNSNSQKFTIQNVPAGTYASVSFLIGVDSIRNISGAQSGALDPANGMFWDWNTGYIMLKFEGLSPSSSATAQQLIFHIGGFSGSSNTIRKITLVFPSPVTIDNNTFQLHIQANAARPFGLPNPVDFSLLNTVHMPGANAVKIAENYANMFSLKSVTAK